MDEFGEARYERFEERRSSHQHIETVVDQLVDLQIAVGLSGFPVKPAVIEEKLLADH